MLDLGPGVILAIGVLAATIAIIVMWKFPELLIAMLLVGQDFVQASFRIFGLEVSRRTFAIAGSVFFGAVVALLVTRSLLKKDSGHRVTTWEHWWIVVTVVLMGLLLVTGLTYTQTPQWGTKLVVDYVTFGVAPFVLCFVFIRDMAGAKRLLIWVFILVAAYMGLVSSHSLITQGKLLAPYMYSLSPDAPKVTLLGVEIRGSQELQDRSTIMLAALFGWFAMTRVRWAKWVLLLSIPVAVAYILMSGTRTGPLIVAAFAFIIPVLMFRRKILAVSVMLVTAILLMIGTYYVLPTEATERLTEPLVGERGTGLSGQYRLQAWSLCLTMIAESPFTGYGTGGFAMADRGMDDEIYPHNMFLQMFAENGVFAFLALCLFWFMVFYFPYRHLPHWRRGDVAYGLLIWVILLMTNEFFKGMLHNAGIAHNQAKIILASGIVARLLMLVSQEEHEVAGRRKETSVELVSPSGVLLADRRI